MPTENNNNNNLTKILIFGGAAALSVTAVFYFLRRRSDPQQQQQQAEIPKKQQQPAENSKPAPFIDNKEKETTPKAVKFDEKKNEEIVIPSKQQQQEKPDEAEQEQQLTEEELKEQEANDNLALEVDTVFTQAFTEAVFAMDWIQSAAVFQRARELLPVAGKFIQVPDEEAKILLEKQDREWNEKISNGGGAAADDDDVEKPQKKSALELKLDDKEERIRYFVKSEELMCQQLRQVLQSSLDLFRCEEYENLPFGDPQKVKKAKDVEAQVEKVVATLARLHAPPAKRSMMLRICENVKELAELNGEMDDETTTVSQQNQEATTTN